MVHTAKAFLLHPPKLVCSQIRSGVSRGIFSIEQYAFCRDRCTVLGCIFKTVGVLAFGFPVLGPTVTVFNSESAVDQEFVLFTSVKGFSPGLLVLSRHVIDRLFFCIGDCYGRNWEVFVRT